MNSVMNKAQTLCTWVSHKHRLCEDVHVPTAPSSMSALSPQDKKPWNETAYVDNINRVESWNWHKQKCCTDVDTTAALTRPNVQGGPHDVNLVIRGRTCNKYLQFLFLKPQEKIQIISYEQYERCIWAVMENSLVTEKCSPDVTQTKTCHFASLYPSL